MKFMTEMLCHMIVGHFLGGNVNRFTWIILSKMGGHVTVFNKFYAAPLGLC